VAARRVRFLLIVCGGMAGPLGAAAPAAGENPDGLAPSHLRRAVVTMPEGVSLSPGAADGLRACSDAQLRLRSDGPDECPDASKIGTAELIVPTLEERLRGSIVVRSSTPDQLFRIAVTLAVPERGVFIRLPGSVQADPLTGQVSAVFDDLPQLPFSNLRLRFKGGPRAMLANPPDCGRYAIHSVFRPWSGTSPVAQDNIFEIGDGACPLTLPFDPRVSAGTVNPVAGASTPFVFRVERPDRNQELSRIELELPPGLTAAVKGVPLCSAPAAVAGDCDEGSRIGTATIGAGPGSAPLYLEGNVYLTGPYLDGPFGLAVSVPAAAGPFDLGTIVVRATIKVDPQTAQLYVQSDPLPRILAGVPLRLRDIHLAIDRPGLVRNPTSCDAMQVHSRVDAVQGATASTETHFQVADCAALGFRPRLAVSLTGPGPATPDTPLGLRARLRARPGDANLESVAFVLPPHVAFDALRRGPRLCTRDQLALRRCPGGSRVGSARAVTPLLDQPLRGPVYFIRGIRGDVFPKLAMLLSGNGVQIDLLGSTRPGTRGLRTTFGVLPDVPISSFTLRLDRGLLTPTRDLCAHRPTARVTMAAQSGRRLDRRLRVPVPCQAWPRLRLRALRWHNGRLAVHGTIRRTARRPVVAAISCGLGTVRRSAHPRRGRFVIHLSVPRPCPPTATPRLVVRYPGDREFAPQTITRRLARTRR
jgi:hypothetical protein